MPEIDDIVRAVLADTPRMTEESFATGRERVLAGVSGESFESDQEHVSAGIGGECFAVGRERVLAGVSGGAGRGRWVKSRRRLIGIAAGVVALMAAALIVPGGEQEVSAATVLNKAADVIQASDVRLAPGQFRYFRMETVRVSSTQRCQYRERDVDEVWIPQDQEAEWLLKRNRGQIEWVTCTDPGAGTLPRKFQEERRAKYGTFDEDPASEPGWYNLTPQFLKTLPRDAQAFYALIQQEYAKTAEPSKAYFQHATYLLQRAALTADLRATLYRAMALIPGVEITEEFATVDGRKGTAIGLAMGSKKDIREDVVINPVDGTLIGRRSVDPDGTLAGWDVITHGVAPGLGERPIG